MPYSDKEKKLMAGLIKEYGAKKAEDVYWGMANEHEKHGDLFSQETKDEIAARHKKKVENQPTKAPAPSTPAPKPTPTTTPAPPEPTDPWERVKALAKKGRVDTTKVAPLAPEKGLAKTKPATPAAPPTQETDAQKRQRLRDEALRDKKKREGEIK